MVPTRTSRLAVATGLAASMLVLGPTAATAASGPAFSAGAPGVGDPYFPLEGNGGYDVSHYLLNLGYDPATDRLDGLATITATATQNLSSFDLDLQGLTAAAVSIDGAPAAFRQDGQELVITPQEGLLESSSFEVAVRYSGIPQPLDGPVVFGLPYGWIATDDGAFVACEPNAASTWYPSNDHPSDKATFTFLVTVPRGLSVVANGTLLAQTQRGDSTTFIWNERRPMATYLATTTIGRFTVREGTTPGGIPVYVASDPSLPPPGPGDVDVYAVTAAATDYWSELFGPYPFEETGGILDNMPIVGYSLETQTKPIYSALRSEGTIVHELSHQWFGDSVSVHSWNNIWLNEGFATYAQWLWDEKKGVRTAHDAFLLAYNRRPATSPFWQVPPGDPQRDTMFSSAVYQRGAMTLQVLREAIGDPAFFTLLRSWAADHRYGNVITEEFISLAEKISGRDLGDLFTTWLYTPGKPALP